MQVNDAILYMLVDSAEKLKFMTVLDFPNNNITDESIGELTNNRENSKMIRNVKYLSFYIFVRPVICFEFVEFCSKANLRLNFQDHLELTREPT